LKDAAGTRAGPAPALLLAGLGATIGLFAGNAPLPALALAVAACGVAAAMSLSSGGAAFLLSAASFLSGVALAIGGLNVRPEQVAGPLVLLGILPRRDSAPAPRLAILAAVWLAAGLLGALGEEETGRALVHGTRILATVLPVVLLPMLLSRRGAAERAWDSFLALAVAESVVALGALLSHALFGTTLGVTLEERLRFVHPQGTLLEPNLVGALAGGAAVAFLLRASDAAARTRTRLFCAAAAALLLAAVFASVTRAAWIAVPLAFALVLAVQRHARLARSLLVAGVLAAALLAIFARSPQARELAEGRSGLAGRLASFTRLADDPNVAARLRSYESALALFSERPLLGAGHGAMERIAAVEDRRLAWAGNLEVHLLVDTGLLGAAAFLLFVAFALLRVASAARASRGETQRRHLERLGALAVLLLCAQATETSWLASFWVLFGLALAAARPREEPAGDERTRILYVHPSDELYGSDRVLLELLRRLDRSRFDPLVALSTDVAYAGRLTRRLRLLGIPVVSLRIGVLRRRVLTSPTRLARFALDVLVSTGRLARLLVEERIALVHANTVTVFPAAIAARLTGRRLVWHVHELVTPRPGRALLNALVHRLAHRVVVVSEAARAALGRSSRAEVIPNGIETRERLGPPAAPPLVAYVGRLSARKGPLVLVRAIARVAERHPAARFVFAGDEFAGATAVQEELLEEARRLSVASRVELRPFAEDVTALLADATVVVTPSILPESFGLVLLEAMASGRPVIASDHGGPREIVVDGETGFLVPPGDEAALAAALDRLLSDPGLAMRLGEAARARARERFAIEHTVARFEALYDELASPRRREEP
jgi:glycosyltransferase involved in cell wall biosynthesis/O-antigen ligase